MHQKRLADRSRCRLSRLNERVRYALQKVKVARKAEKIRKVEVLASIHDYQLVVALVVVVIVNSVRSSLVGSFLLICLKTKLCGFSSKQAHLVEAD